MYALPNKYIGSFAELTTYDNVLLTSGKILKVGEDYIEVANGFHSDAIRKEVGPVKLNIKSGVSPSLFLQGTIYLPSRETYRLINIDIFSEGDKRSFFRLPTNDQVEINVDSKEEPEFVKMKDISLGGMMLETGSEFFLNELVHMTLYVNGSPLTLNGNINRVSKTEHGTYRYGVMFLSLSPKESDTLCNYIFQRQKAEINRLKG